MRSKALLHIASQHVRMDIVEAGQVRSAHVEFKCACDDTAWTTGSASLCDAIRDVVSKLGAEGAETYLLYSSPTGVVDVHRSPASRSDALQSAALALREAAPHVTDRDPRSVESLGRDASGDPRCTHIMSCTDTVSSLLAIMRVTEEAGLRVAGALPASAATIGKAMQHALKSMSGDVRADLRIDEHHAMLTAQGEGRVFLSRVIDLGVDRLLDAICTFESDDSETFIDRERAQEFLMEQGIPRADEPLTINPALSGADVLPLIQPTLQRLVVEIKQSLRFSLSESQRDQLVLHVDGIGAAVPRLAEIIGREADLQMSVTRSEAEDAGRTAEHDATVAIADHSSLVPPHALTARVDRKFRRGLACGVAMTALVLVADAAWNLHVSRTMDTHIDSLAEVASAAGSARQTLETVQDEWMGVIRAVHHITEVVPRQAHWGAWLADLSRMTPKAIQLTHIGGEVQRGLATVRLNGVSKGETSESARQSITHFVETLRGSPLVSSVEVGGIRRGDGGHAHEFELTVNLQATRVTPPSEGDSS